MDRSRKVEVMEKAFFDLFGKHRNILRLEVGYMRQTDWSVTVYRAGIDGEWILGVQDPDRAMAFAKAT